MPGPGVPGRQPCVWLCCSSSLDPLAHRAAARRNDDAYAVNTHATPQGRPVSSRAWPAGRKPASHTSTCPLICPQLPTPPPGTPIIVKSMLGFASFGDAHAHKPTQQENIHIVLMVAIPFAAAAVSQFVLAWCAAQLRRALAAAPAAAA